MGPEPGKKQETDRQQIHWIKKVPGRECLTTIDRQRHGSRQKPNRQQQQCVVENRAATTKKARRCGRRNAGLSNWAQLGTQLLIEQSQLLADVHTHANQRTNHQQGKNKWWSVKQQNCKIRHE